LRNKTITALAPTLNRNQALRQGILVEVLETTLQLYFDYCSATFCYVALKA